MQFTDLVKGQLYWMDISDNGPWLVKFDSIDGYMLSDDGSYAIKSDSFYEEGELAELSDIDEETIRLATPEEIETFKKVGGRIDFKNEAYGIY